MGFGSSLLRLQQAWYTDSPQRSPAVLAETAYSTASEEEKEPMKTASHFKKLPLPIIVVRLFIKFL